MRQLALRGGPYSDDERAALLVYCEQDVDGLARLLPPMLPGILARVTDPTMALGQRYCAVDTCRRRPDMPDYLELRRFVVAC